MHISFLKVLKFQSVFHDLPNQYQACWYLFECIFHGDSKYSNEIEHIFNLLKKWHFYVLFVSQVLTLLQWTDTAKATFIQNGGMRQETSKWCVWNEAQIIAFMTVLTALWTSCRTKTPPSFSIIGLKYAKMYTSMNDLDSVSE